MPARARVVIGLIGSVIIALSSVGHSLMGWTAQRERLEQLHASPEVMRGLMIGWLFGGLATLVFGVITALSFVQVLRGRTPHMRATLIIGFTYTGFGIWSWSLTREPFLLVFVVPGLLVLTGAAGHKA